MRALLLLSLGATVGAAARYYLGILIAEWLSATFPYGTLLINIVGSFILGAFLTLSEQRQPASPELRLLIATGFCGSFTTFSTFSYESLTLLLRGDYLASTLYILGSVLLGLTAVALGGVLIRALF